MSRPRVVCTRALPDADQRERLAALCKTIVVADADDFAAALAGADGAVVILPVPLTASMIGSAPRLRVVATVSSGVDHIDLAALEQRGIALVSGAGKAPGAVAEWVVWATIGMLRGFPEIAARFAAGRIDWGERVDLGSRELGAATVGILGFGNVGRAVLRLLEPFEPHMLVFDPFVPSPEGCEAVAGVGELCERAEVVTVHVPLTESTRGLIATSELALLGPAGLLVNAARGGIVEPNALLAALSDGTLGGAAIDCFDPEPADPDYVAALAATGRALVTPHVAGVSGTALAALCKTAVDGIEAVLFGDRDANGEAVVA